MEPIRKSASRKPGCRKDRLFRSIDRYAILAFLALPIIAGLETYYRNLPGTPGTTCIGGLWTLLYGVWLTMAFFRRNKGVRQFSAQLKIQGRNLEEGITFSEEAFIVDIRDYCQFSLPWSSLTAVENERLHLRFSLAGIEFMIPTKNFTTKELEEIKTLLNRKQQALLDNTKN